MCIILTLALLTQDLRFTNNGNVGTAVAVELEDNNWWALTAKHCYSGSGKCYVDNLSCEPYKFGNDDVLLLKVEKSDNFNWKPRRLEVKSYKYSGKYTGVGYTLGAKTPTTYNFIFIQNNPTKVIVSGFNEVGRSGGPLYSPEGKIVGILSTTTIGGFQYQSGYHEKSSDFVNLQAIWSIWE